MQRVRLIMPPFVSATLVQIHLSTPVCCAEYILSDSLRHRSISAVSRGGALAIHICARKYICIQA